MDKKIFLAIGIIAIALLIAGCTQPAQCGNGTCDTGEDAQLCPADCENTADIPMPPSSGNNETPPALPF